MSPDWQGALGRLQPDTVAAAARRWVADPPTLVNAGFNHVYRAVDPQGSLYLRFTHVELRDRAFLTPPLAYLRHAFTHGAQVNEPLPSASGHWIEALPQGDDLFFCTAVRGVDGARLSDLPPTPALYRAFGQAIGSLHAASASFQPDPAWPHMIDAALPGTFPTWRLFWDRAGASAHREATIAQAYDDLTPWVHAVGGRLAGWPGGEAEPGVGLTHGDLRPGNAIWDGQRVVIIDFDEQVYAPLANDLARAVLELTREQRRRLVPELLRGYREHMPLEFRWEEAVPGLVRARAVLMAAWQLEGEGDPTNLRPVSGSAAPVSAWQLREHLRAGAYGS